MKTKRCLFTIGLLIGLAVAHATENNSETTSFSGFVFNQQVPEISRGMEGPEGMYFVVGEEILWEIYVQSENGEPCRADDLIMDLFLEYISGEQAVSYLAPYSEEGTLIENPDGSISQQYHLYVDSPCVFVPRVHVSIQSIDNDTITVSSSVLFHFLWPYTRSYEMQSFYLEENGSLDNPDTFVGAHGFLGEESWQVVYHYANPDEIDSPIFTMSGSEYYDGAEMYLREMLVPMITVPSGASQHHVIPVIAAVHNRMHNIASPMPDSTGAEQLPLFTTEYDPLICQSVSPLPDEFVFRSYKILSYKIRRPDQDGFTNEEGFWYGGENPFTADK